LHQRIPAFALFKARGRLKAARQLWLPFQRAARRDDRRASARHPERAAQPRAEGPNPRRAAPLLKRTSTCMDVKQAPCQSSALVFDWNCWA